VVGRHYPPVGDGPVVRDGDPCGASADPDRHHLAPYTRGCLFSLYEIVALLLVVIFGFRKQLVIRVVGRPEQVRHRGIFAIVSAIYPALWLAAAALLVAGLCRVRRFRRYVVYGSAKTVATITVALLAARYLTDLLIPLRPCLRRPA